MATTDEVVASTEAPVTVVGEILPGRPDPSSLARFANYQRAAAYIERVLFADETYVQATITDGATTYVRTHPAREE